MDERAAALVAFYKWDHRMAELVDRDEANELAGEGVRVYSDEWDDIKDEAVGLARRLAALLV